MDTYFYHIDSIAQFIENIQFHVFLFPIVYYTPMFKKKKLSLHAVTTFYSAASKSSFCGTKVVLYGQIASRPVRHPDIVYCNYNITYHYIKTCWSSILPVHTLLTIVLRHAHIVYCHYTNISIRDIGFKDKNLQHRQILATLKVSEISS